MTKKGPLFQKVPLETKLNIIKLCLEEGCSALALAKVFGVSSPTLYTWGRIYRRDGGLDVLPRGQAIGYTQLDYKERYEILEKVTLHLKEVDAKKRKDLSTIIKTFIPSP